MRLSVEEAAILNELLDRYERSKWFREGRSSQRVMMKAENVPALMAMQENADARRAMLNGLAHLKQSGLIDYSWVKYEKGNLVDEIWLCTDGPAIAEAYKSAARVPKNEKLDCLARQIEEALDSFSPDSDIRMFLAECMDTIRVKRRMPRFFSDEEDLTDEILRFLAVAEALSTGRPAIFDEKYIPGELGPEPAQQEGPDGSSEMMERVISTRLYGDSKHFERVVKPKVLSILRYMDTDGLSDEQLLMRRGVTRWPQIFEFTGPIALLLQNGREVSFGELTEGAYMNSGTLSRIRKVKLSSLRRILFIENKANYVDYVARRRKPDELVVFHGGVFSPAAGRWFSLLAEARAEFCPEAECFHWSDIDLGGFGIFVRLRDTCFPDLKPWMMDEDTLRLNRDKAMTITSDSYLRQLQKLVRDERYSVFHPVIRYMLTENIRLEQEALL